ncbi:MAG: polyphenol oxidase family protein [Acidimicrobiia bacterium]
MIRPPGFRGAVFAGAAHGDARHDPAARSDLAGALDIAAAWAFVRQVHGVDVVEATTPGLAGDADAVFTTVPGLPVAIATADCVPVVLEGSSFVAVVHAGWRGAAAGVVTATLARLGEEGLVVERAAVGPAIGPCCYEVGPEVAARFATHLAETTWGTRSVDLPGLVVSQLERSGAAPTVWSDMRCTYTSRDLYSFRGTATSERQVTVGWLP